MTKQDYLNQRQELMNTAKQLVEEGKIEEFKNKKDEIEALDERYEAEAKAQTELDALNAGVKVTDIKSHTTSVIGQTIATFSHAEDDITNTTEYRKAFMSYVTKGTSMPNEFKNTASTKTTDIGEMIPETVLQRIIEKMEATGMILPLITRTAVKGGITIPTSSVKPVATWVSEGAGSTKQKKTTGHITFAYHKLRCAVAVSLEVDTMALAVFETTLINNVAEAMIKALEESILKGTGVGQPKGILTEEVVEGQNIDVKNTLTYNTLIEMESALPFAYEKDAVYFMTKRTFMAFMGIVDANGQPIARVNYGINGKPERALLGRNVIINDYMDSITTAPANTVVAFLFNPKDYILNTNFTMGIREYYDEETEDRIKKSVMLVDGKVVDKNSLVTLTKTGTATVAIADTFKANEKKVAK